MALDRNLASINNKLLKRSQILQSTIRDLGAGPRAVSVLEVGCGAGFALMELAWEFRRADVRFHAINKTRRPLASSEDLRRTARQIGLGDEELRRLRLPELAIGDATRMDYENERFDLVYLSSVLRFVPRKAEFLEEIGRVLRPGGVALVRVASNGWRYPFGAIEDDEKLTRFPSRWVLKHHRELIPLDLYLKGLSGAGFDFEFINAPACVIRMRKRRAGRLALGLRYEPSLSRPMRELPYGDEEIGRATGGIRSVYEVRRSTYRNLVDRGFLTDRARASPPAPAGTGAWAGRGPGAKQRDRLSRWEVGQRVQVKGRKSELRFRAAKIKMVRYDRSSDVLVGVVEGVDPRNRTIRLLGVDVDLNGTPPPGHGKTPSQLKSGMTIKAVGEYAAGRFRARKIRAVPRAAIPVDVVQARIERIDAAAGALRVAGVEIETSAVTKIDRVDQR